MIQETQPSSTQHHMIDGIIVGFARHWLLIFNTLWAVYILLPLLAPLLLAAGFATGARYIYSIYSFACHNLPDHSYFFFGQHLVPDLEQLVATGMPANLSFFEQRLFLGNDVAGFKTAICQRDIAIYGTVLVSGLVYSRVNRGKYRLNWPLYVLLMMPMVVDGGSQLLGLRESNWWLRTLTGALFGGASVWFAYPHIDEALTEAIREPTPVLHYNEVEGSRP